MRAIHIVFALALLLSSCLPAPTPQVIVVTATPQATETPRPTNSPTATATKRPTLTPRPSNTSTETPEPLAATQTAVVAIREATRAFDQNIANIKATCLPIDWEELSEVQYAKDHEGECVRIKGQIWEVDFDEKLLSVWIGYYSSDIVVGIDWLNSTPGRLTEDTWITAYGKVSTTSWITRNRLDNSEKAITGVQALLIEGPNGLIWVQEGAKP